MQKHLVTTMMTVLLLLLTACASITTPSPDEIGTKIQESFDTPMHGILNTNNQMSGAREETNVMEKWHNGPEQVRTTIVEDTQGFAGNILVRNGDEMWFYHFKENVYSYVDVSKLSTAEQASRPMLETIKGMLTNVDITYLGSGEMAGRKSHELKFTPKEGREDAIFMPGDTTLSVDSETWYPLKLEIQGEDFSVKIEYSEIEFNPDFPPDIFTFEPPEGAKELGLPEEEEEEEE